MVDDKLDLAAAIRRNAAVLLRQVRGLPKPARQELYERLRYGPFWPLAAASRFSVPSLAKPSSIADDDSDLPYKLQKLEEWEKAGHLKLDPIHRALIERLRLLTPAPGPILVGWRLIETAPRSNGSIAFLAFIPGHGQCVCACTALGNVYSLSSNRTLNKASHWRPLPNPPMKLHFTDEALRDMIDKGPEEPEKFTAPTRFVDSEVGELRHQLAAANEAAVFADENRTFQMERADALEVENASLRAELSAYAAETGSPVGERL